MLVHLLGSKVSKRIQCERCCDELIGRKSLALPDENVDISLFYPAYSFEEIISVKQQKLLMTNV